MDDRAEAWVKVAVRPVTLVQDEGVEFEEPETKFTAAHLENVNNYPLLAGGFGRDWERRKREKERAKYLVQETISSILDNADDTLVAGPA